MRRREFIAGVSGLAAARSFPALAQQKRVPTVAYLWHAGSEAEERPFFGAIRDGFAKLGYVDGRTIRLVHRFPNEIPERFASMAAELAAMDVDVLMGGGIASSYLKKATDTIPIVFMFVADPVGLGLVKSLSRPGGNATGLSNFGRDIGGKRLEVLKELVPGLSRVGFLIDSNLPQTRMYVDVMSAAATQLGLELQMFEAHSRGEMEPAFDAMVKAGMQAATLEQGGTTFQARDIIPKLALDRRLPLSVDGRERFEYGSLVSYGPNNVEACYRGAIYVDKILKGEKPGDIPVEQPSKFELLINLKTAKTLGLTVPPTLLARADEVIE